MAATVDAPSPWSKALRRDAQWTTEELQDVTYWVRQAVSALLGVLFGVLGVTGWAGMATYVAVSAGVVHVYYRSYLRVDDQEHGGPWEVHKDAFMSAFATFLLTWIVTHTTAHTA